MTRAKSLRISVILFLTISVISASENLIEINKVKIADLPFPIDSELIGFRIAADRIVTADKNGNIASVEIDSKNIELSKSDAGEIIDFDLRKGKLVCLCPGAEIIGAKPESDALKEELQATEIEIAEDGSLFLIGGSRLLHVPINATYSISIPDINFIRPIKNGFMWVLKRDPDSKRWELDLYDYFGNLMKSVYAFSAGFNPGGLQFGPTGPDGELLISASIEGRREIMAIAPSGRMLWRIQGPAQFCRRDFGWDNRGNLLLLERENGKTVLNRWSFSIPEG